MQWENQQAQMETLIERWSRMPGSAVRGFSKYRTVDFLKGIPKEKFFLRATIAQLLENAYQWLRGLDESTRTVHIGSFEKFLFPLIRAAVANTIAHELVTVQALTAPTGTVFYMNMVYGTAKGRIQRGGLMYDVRTGPARDIHYTDEIVEEEAVATGTGAQVQYTGAVAHVPVRPGTLKFTDGTAAHDVVDNGNGGLTGPGLNPAGTNTINYANGAYNFTYLVAPALGATLTASYEYDMEASFDTPEIELVMTSSPVTARTQRIKALVSIESQQNFQAYFGASADVELTAYMSNELNKEINYKIIRHLRQIAAATAAPVQWDRTPPAAVPWIWHKESFYDSLIAASNSIFSATQRRGGSWVVASVQVCDVLETLQKFKPSGAGTTADAGPRRIGEIGEFAVFKDPTYPANEYLMGYKGPNWLDTGYIHAPFLGVYVMPLITLDDLMSRKAMMQRTGQKVVNPFFYVRGQIIQTGGAFGP